MDVLVANRPKPANSPSKERKTMTENNILSSGITGDLANLTGMIQAYSEILLSKRTDDETLKIAFKLAVVAKELEYIRNRLYSF
jgi:hypothetical protein